MSHVRKQMITFNLGAECNLRCIYCYAERQKINDEDKVLDLNFAKKGIDDFFRDYPSRNIRFYSAGEPTLQFNLMKKITEYARKKTSQKVAVELQTNGFFSSKIAKWIDENVNVLWISSDGPQEIQNKQRPTISGKPSASIVDNWIKHYAHCKHIQFGVRVTLTSLKMERQMDIVKYFYNMGVKFINVHPACVSVEEKSKKEKIFDWDPIVFASNFLKTHLEAKKLRVFYNSLYIANFDEPTRHACRSCTPYPHLTTDGYVSCCDFSQFGPKYGDGHLQQLIYGKYIPEKNCIEYDEDKIYRIRSRCSENLTKGPCKECEYINYCAGGCLGQVVNETGDLMGIHKKNCEITKYLAKRLPLGKGLYPVLHS